MTTYLPIFLSRLQSSVILVCLQAKIVIVYYFLCCRKSFLLLCLYSLEYNIWSPEINIPKTRMIDKKSWLKHFIHSLNLCVLSILTCRFHLKFWLGCLTLRFDLKFWFGILFWVLTYRLDLKLWLGDLTLNFDLVVWIKLFIWSFNLMLWKFT